MKLVKFVPYYEMVPKWHGKVRDKIMGAGVEVAPIPLCFILRAWWHVYFLVMFPRRSWWERHDRAIYRAGFEQGQGELTK